MENYVTKLEDMKIERSFITINLDNLRYNYEEIKKCLFENETMACVVKANAYGCGYYKVIETMEKAGINFYAVGNINEALEVRKYSDKGIIILTPVFEEVISTTIENNISVTVDSLEYLKSLENALYSANNLSRSSCNTPLALYFLKKFI